MRERMRLTLSMACLVLASLGVATASAFGQGQRLHGRVVDPAGDALRDADVQLLPNGALVVTNDSGAFDLGPVAGGAYTVAVRRLGYQPMQVQVEMPSASAGITVTMTPLPVVLDTVRTLALEHDVPRMFHRMQVGLGAAVFGEELTTRYPGMSLRELLRFDNRLSKVLLSGSHGPGCWTDIFVNGQKADPLEIENVREEDIAAIEAFNSPDFVSEPGIATRYPAGSCRHVVLVWLSGFRQKPWGTP